MSSSTERWLKVDVLNFTDFFSEEAFAHPSKPASDIGRVKLHSTSLDCSVEPRTRGKFGVKRFCHGRCAVDHGHIRSQYVADSGMKERIMRTAKDQRVDVVFREWGQIFL